MSHILCQWLNSEVGVSNEVHAQDMDDSFRSGYLLAELLHRHQLIDNLGAFQSSFSVDGAIKNFTLLEPVLRSIGCPLTSNVAHEVITGKEGAAARLLYQIKTGLLGVTTTTASPVKGAGTTDRALHTLPRYVLEATNKKRFVEKEHEFFADRLKAKFRRNVPPVANNGGGSVAKKEHRMDGSPTRFVQSEPKVHKNPVRKESPVHDQRQAWGRHNASGTGTQRSPSQKPVKEVAGEDVLTQASRFAAQQSEVLRMKMEMKKAEQAMKKKSLMQEMAKEVQTFEAHLHHVKTNATAITPNTATHATIDPKELRRQIRESTMESEAHVRAIQKKLPPVETTDRQSQLYLQKIRAKRLEEEASRKEREQRRRKLLLGQQKTQEDLERNQREAILLQKLTKQSKQERRIAEQLLEMKYEKEVMRQNRLTRDHQYQERRQRDFEEALQREAVLGRQLRLDYQRHTAELSAQYQEIVEKKRQLRREKVTRTCREVAEQLAEFSLNMIYQREVNDGVVPQHLVDQWKVLFVKGYPLDQQYVVPLSKECAVSPLEELPLKIQQQQQQASAVSASRPVSPNNAEKSQVGDAATSAPEEPIPQTVLAAVDAVDDAEFDNYLNGNDSWSFTKNGAAPEKNTHLGKLVESLFQVMSQEEPKEHISKLSAFPLKIVLLGKRFSGKRSIAAKLASDCSLKTIQVDDIIQDAIQSAEKKEATVDDKGKPVPTVRAQLGAKAQEALVSGSEVSEEVTAALVADALRTLNAKISSQEPGAQGWILVDYPKSKAQAQLLEKELSGYEEAKTPKLGNLKRNQSSALDGNHRSLIAPASSQDQTANESAESVIDAILVLDAENDVAIRRAVGRRIDPITGEIYHLEFRPPPSDQPGVAERLVPAEGLNNNDDQLQLQLSAYEDQQAGIREWFSKFGNLHTVNANTELNQVLESVESVLKPIIDKKSIVDKTAPTEPDATAPQATTTTESVAANEAPSTPASVPEPPPSVLSRPSTAANLTTPKSAKPNSATTISIKAENLVRLPFAGLGVVGLTKEMATILYNKWVAVESTYTNGMKFVFRSLRREREAAMRYFYETKVHYKEFLVRPDKKQVLVDAFQKEFNAIDDDLRYDADAKAEFHQRAEDLRERLWTLSDDRREEAEVERASIIEHRWAEDHMAAVAQLYVHAMQLEVDRYVATKQLVLDYTRDANEVLVDDNQLTTVKVLPLDWTAWNAIDTLFHDIVKIKHELPVSLIPANVTRNKVTAATTATQRRATTAVKKPTTTERQAESASAEASATSAAPAPTEVTIDNDAVYTAVVSAMNAVLAVVTDLEFTAAVEAKEVKPGDKKSGKATPAVDMQADNKDIHPEAVQDAKECIRRENTTMRYRLERLLDRAGQHLREFKQRAYQTFILLDEWLGTKFQDEMDAIRDLTNVIKEAIELEQKLTHELVLESDKFFVNLEVLAYEPEPEPRPLSPVEQRKPSAFTVLQLLNMGMQLQEAGPGGRIATKEWKDLLRRLVSAGPEWMPDQVQSAMDVQAVHQLVHRYDPYHTGYAQWYDFILDRSQVLPVSQQELLRLKAAFEASDETRTGTVDYVQYSAIKLWFEFGGSEVRITSSSTRFDRAKKLKEAFFHIFADATTSGDGKTGAVTGSARWIKEHERLPVENKRMNYRRFLLSLCADPSPKEGLQKAFAVCSQRNDGAVTMDELRTIYRLQAYSAEDQHCPVRQHFPQTVLRELMLQFPEDEQWVTFTQLERYLEEATVPNAFLKCSYYQMRE